MSGTWATARAAVKAQCHGVAVSSPFVETLTAYEYAPGGRQDLVTWPYAFPLPTGRSVRHEPGEQRYITTDLAVRVMVAPVGTEDMETLHQRYDSWCDALADAFDDAIAFDNTVDQWLTQDFGPLLLFEDIDRGWGFDMTFGGVELSETKTPGG